MPVFKIKAIIETEQYTSADFLTKILEERIKTAFFITPKIILLEVTTNEIKKEGEKS